MKEICLIFFELPSSKFQSVKTSFMLNHLTLQIRNKEVARNFEVHQAQKIDRLLYGGILGAGVYLVSSIINAQINKSGPWVAVLNNAFIFPLMVTFRFFRFCFKANTSLHEYLVIMIFAVGVILCTLSNTHKLPESLSGPGIDEFRSSFAG